MNERGVALSLDLDGVVFPRIPVQWKALFHYAMKGRAIYQPPELVEFVDRPPLNDPPGLIESGLLAIHRKRKVPRDVIDTFADTGGITICGNTGRPNSEAWVAMTIEALLRDGVLGYFENVYFRPQGLSTRESKATVVDHLRQQYPRVIHFDDNPADALPIAACFPDVKVVIVQDLTTGLLYSRREAQRYPNVRRVASFRAGVQILGLDRYKSGLSLS